MTSFSLNLKAPIKQIGQYISVLKNVSLQQLEPSQVNKIPTPNSFWRSEYPCKNVAEYEKKCLAHRTVLYCAAVHPVAFSKNGGFDNWYDVESIFSSLKRKEWLYDERRLAQLYSDVFNQMPFIQKIQSSHIDFENAFSEQSLVRYAQFMTLVKKYENDTDLVPPFDVDIVWHAHMLDHVSYVRASKSYFGRILDHKDNPIPVDQLKKDQEKTAAIWDKHYGPSKSELSGATTTTSSSGCTSDGWLTTTHTSSSSETTDPSSCSSSCSSCSSCSSD